MSRLTAAVASASARAEPEHVPLCSRMARGSRRSPRWLRRHDSVRGEPVAQCPTKGAARRLTSASRGARAEVIDVSFASKGHSGQSAAARPLREPALGVAPCLRPWRSSSAGVSKPTTWRLAPPAAGYPFGSPKERRDQRRPDHKRSRPGSAPRAQIARNMRRFTSGTRVPRASSFDVLLTPAIPTTITSKRFSFSWVRRSDHA